VPLREPADHAISLSVPAARLGPDTEERIVVALREAMTQIRAARSLITAI